MKRAICGLLVLLAACLPVDSLPIVRVRDCAAPQREVVVTTERATYQVVADWRREHPASRLCRVEAQVAPKETRVTIWYE